MKTLSGQDLQGGCYVYESEGECKIQELGADSSS